MAVPGRSTGRSFGLGLAAVVAVAVLARLALMVPGFEHRTDPDRYLVLARSLAGGKGFALGGRPTAYRPPLYPILLTPLVATLGDQLAWGVAALHLALSAGTVALTALAGRRWGLSPARALIASAIVACDPVLLAQARVVMTETPSALLVAAVLAALAGDDRRGPLLGGLACGLAALCRPSFLAAAGLTAAAALFARPGDGRARLRRATVLTVATAATLAPWAWRNARVLGAPVWTTTHGGYTLALANNPVYYAEVLDGPPGAVWSGPGQRRWFEAARRAQAALSEPEFDRRMRAEGLRMLAERPRDFARAARARLRRFWGVAPSDAVYPRKLRLATAAWTIPLWIALVLGLSRRASWRWPKVAAPALLLALSAVHAVFWTDLRMRAPLVPAIALIAVGGPTGRMRTRGQCRKCPEITGAGLRDKKNRKSSRILAVQIPEKR
jgi:hypothetical protein